MTNPDNVGGLPAKWLAEADADEKRAGYETAEAITLRRVAAELCRAAPAGGDAVRDALAGQTIYLMGREHINEERKPLAELVYGMTVPGTGVLFCMKDTEAAIPKDADQVRKFRGVGELERTGYIPAGSADERDARDEQEYDDEQCFPEHEVEAMKLEAVQDDEAPQVREQRRLHEEMLEWEERVEGGDISARELWRQVRPSLGTLRRLLRDSAPAGSGEVEELAKLFEEIGDSAQRSLTSHVTVSAKSLRDAAALLRKLQQGAE